MSRDDPLVLPEDRRIGPVERVLMLKRIPSLASLSAADLGLLAEHGRERLWSRGTALLRDGEPVETAHLVFEGRVRLSRRGRALGVAKAGASIGSTLLLARDEVGLDAVAETDAVTLALDREGFFDALEERFEMLHVTLRDTCRDIVTLLVGHPLEAPPVPRAKAPRPGAQRELDLVERILLLRGTQPFESCSVSALAELAQQLEEVRIEEGTPLWRRGDRSERMLMVVSGRVRAQGPNVERPFYVEPGQTLGALEVLGEVPRWYDAVAEEPVIGLACDGTQVLDVFEDDVATGVEVLRYLARSSVRVQERVAAQHGAVPPLFACDGRCG